MKILLVHNKYGTLSGEEIMFKRVVGILQEHGHEVYEYTEDSASIISVWSKFAAFFSGIYSFASKKKIISYINKIKPDIVQIQNLYPLISPSILPTLVKFNIPVIMRVSNYRLICPNGLFLSHGKICERCKGGHEYYCFIQNCEGDWFKSLGYALRSIFARKFRFYHNGVTHFYAQTEFQRSKLIEQGFCSRRISVIPNMIDSEVCNYSEDIKKVPCDYVAYAGRLSGEKGVNVYLDAAKICTSIQFRIAGNASNLTFWKKYSSINVVFLGHLDKANLIHFLAGCSILVMPSICYEGFPNIIIEAMSIGKPVIASNIGGIKEIVEDGKTGFLFKVGDSEDLAKKINLLENDEALRTNMGIAAKKRVDRLFNSEIYYRKLIAIYEASILEKK